MLAVKKKYEKKSFNNNIWRTLAAFSKIVFKIGHSYENNFDRLVLKQRHKRTRTEMFHFREGAIGYVKKLNSYAL